MPQPLRGVAGASHRFFGWTTQPTEQDCLNDIIRDAAHRLGLHEDVIREQSTEIQKLVEGYRTGVLDAQPSFPPDQDVPPMLAMLEMLVKRQVFNEDRSGFDLYIPVNRVMGVARRLSADITLDAAAKQIEQYGAQDIKPELLACLKQRQGQLPWLSSMRAT